MIQIIGAGAIGCLWLAKIQLSGSKCHLVSRMQSCLPHLTFTDLNGQIHNLTISHGNTLLHLNPNHKASTLLVCVKAQHVLSALLMQKQYINPQQIIILMHNGYGSAEEVIKHFPNNTIICATTANASLLNSPLNITQTGAGYSYLGMFKTGKDKCNPPDAITPLQRALPDTEWSDDIIQKCWLKLIINAAINPLTAIHQIKNGQLNEHQFTMLTDKIITEAFTVALKEGFDFKLADLKNTVQKVINATAENYSSMNRDIFYQRETEIEFINGYLIKKARQYRIEVPLINSLYAQIKELESRLPTPVNTL
ncbi:2-dehydropantoate 2-reductase [Psychromonas sp.]|nr:2-dehydropantoate 2-reductase [Psychromonas sp.]